MDIIAILLYTFLFLLITLLLYPFIMKYNKHKATSKPKVPPGSMGWPYIGETLQLYSQHPNTFFASKQKRFPYFIPKLCMIQVIYCLSFKNV